MKIVTIECENEKMARDFVIWFSGGGEQAYSDATEVFEPSYTVAIKFDYTKNKVFITERKTEKS